MRIRHLLYQMGHATASVHHEIIGRTSIGRASESDIWIDDGEASRSHALLLPQLNGKLCLVDLGSRNGTFVDGSRQACYWLTPGAQIQIGKVRFRYEVAEPEEDLMTGTTVPAGCPL